jgi:23S rRNA C2498 (ribose-2'-O)-methylase RlmM
MASGLRAGVIARSAASETFLLRLFVYSSLIFCRSDFVEGGLFHRGQHGRVVREVVFLQGGALSGSCLLLFHLQTNEGKAVKDYRLPMETSDSHSPNSTSCF